MILASIYFNFYCNTIVVIWPTKHPNNSIQANIVYFLSLKIKQKNI